jgi:hypothetical protein
MLYNAAIGPSDGTVSFYRQRGFDSANPNIGNSIGASTFQTHASVNPNTPISVPQFGEAAKLPFPSTSTCCGNRLRPGKGMDTRRLQHFFGHASITNTVRYTAMSPEPLKTCGDNLPMEGPGCGSRPAQTQAQGYGFARAMPGAIDRGAAHW